MSLEQVIAANTEALINLTELLVKQSMAPAPKSVAPLDALIEQAQELKTGYVETPKKVVTYNDARELILELVATHRDEIKAINDKHGVTRLSDVLKDPDDKASEVLEPSTLEGIYADLLALKNS